VPDANLWEIQGFIEGYGNGRPAWSTDVNGDVGLLVFLADVLNDADLTAILIRRSGSDEEHVRLVEGDAR
jgi:hypothetical protein